MPSQRMQIFQIGFFAAINFDLNTRLTVPQEKFLSNSKNKQRLINLLSRTLIESDCSIALADEDADVLLVYSSKDLAKTEKHVVLVGQDIDLLVLLTQKTPAELNTVYFLKIGKTYQSDCWYSNKSLRCNLLQKYIAFLHVVTGCDTVSCMHKQGKNKLLKTFNDRPDLLYLMDIFYEANADRDMIANNGYKIISLLYPKKGTGSLNSHRYQQFVRMFSESNVPTQIFRQLREQRNNINIDRI